MPIDIETGLLPCEPEHKFRGYCESCGTMGLHGWRCATCGFSFVTTVEAARPSAGSVGPAELDSLR